MPCVVNAYDNLALHLLVLRGNFLLHCLDLQDCSAPRIRVPLRAECQLRGMFVRSKEGDNSIRNLHRRSGIVDPQALSSPEPASYVLPTTSNPLVNF